MEDTNCLSATNALGLGSSTQVLLGVFAEMTMCIVADRLQNDQNRNLRKETEKASRLHPPLNTKAKTGTSICISNPFNSREIIAYECIFLPLKKVMDRK